MESLDLLFPLKSQLGHFLASKNYHYQYPCSPEMKVLLATTFIACTENTANRFPKQPASTSQNNFCQSEIVNWVIAKLMDRSESNIICHGYRKPNAKSHGFVGMSRLENYFPNSLVTLIKEPVWQELLDGFQMAHLESATMP